MIICVSSGIFQTIPKQEPRHLEITRTNINHDKKILVLYHDEIKRLHILTERINQKMDISLYDIDHAQVPDADNFDLILLGTEYQRCTLGIVYILSCPFITVFIHIPFDIQMFTVICFQMIPAIFQFL